MRIILFIFVLSLLLAENVQAGNGPDNCLKEQQKLQELEAGDCSGFNYLLNPSACFATRKALKELIAADRCKNSGSAEKGKVQVPGGIPTKTTIGTTASGVTEKKPEPGTGPAAEGCTQLQEENSRLKAEIIRLTTENTQLRLSCH